MIHFRNSASPAALSYAAVQSDPARAASQRMTPEQFIDEIATQVEDRLIWHNMALIGGQAVFVVVLGMILRAMV